MISWVFVATLLSLAVVPTLGWDDANFVSREQWNAVPVKPDPANKYPKKPTLVIVHHSGSESCSNREECIRKVKYMQKSHINMGFSDIGYNFLIGGDGLVYEGRGFDYSGAHTRGYNSLTLGFAFIGHFVATQPKEQMLERAKEFLENAAKRESFASNYKVAGASQLVATISPGEKLMDSIKKWPRFTNDPKKWLQSPTF